MENNILAIIVTYNRLECLKECIAALRGQTYKEFDILVVNNGSNDGTKEYLESQESILKIHQENLGGAGGFYAGMKYMYEHRYEWLWMMDDDGIADKHQLENLLKYAGGEYLFLNALVVNIDDHSRLSFGKMQPVESFDGKTLTDEVFHPFNGTFVHWSVVDKVGLIKKEMFIWGDEQEYRCRVKSYGYKEFTVVPAIHYHPREKGKKLYVLPYISKRYIWDKPSNLSWIYYRNMGYITKNYHNKWYSKLGVVGNYIIALTWRLKFKELYKFYKYYNWGRKGIFDKQ